MTNPTRLAYSALSIETLIEDGEIEMINHCEKCSRSLERRDEETDSIVIEAGETRCCCGDFDEHGNHENALCVDCCGLHGNEIWEGKSTGGGYYIVNPSY